MMKRIILSLSIISIGALWLHGCASEQAKVPEAGNGDALIVETGSGSPCSGAQFEGSPDNLQEIPGNDFKLRVNGVEESLCDFLVKRKKRVLVVQVSFAGCIPCKPILKSNIAAYGSGTAGAQSVALTLASPEKKSGGEYKPISETRSFFGYRVGDVLESIDPDGRLFTRYAQNIVPLVVVMNQHQQGFTYHTQNMGDHETFFERVLRDSVNQLLSGG